jgi:hypothetical protein
LCRHGLELNVRLRGLHGQRNCLASREEGEKQTNEHHEHDYRLMCRTVAWSLVGC